MESITLANGVTGLFIQDDKFKTTTISILFYLPLERATQSADVLLPQLLTGASEEYPDFTALARRLDALYGAQLDGVASKNGDYLQVRLSVKVIDDQYARGEAVVSQAGALLASLLFAPKLEGDAFDEATFLREKRLLRERILANINDKRHYAREKCIETLCEGEPFGLPELGAVEQLEATSAKDAFAAWNRFLENAVIRIQVVGAEQPKSLFERFAAAFGGMRRQPCLIAPPAGRAARREPAVVRERMDVLQGKLVLGFRGYATGDEKQTLPLLMMADLFGGGTHSKLFVKVREEMSLCYYCAAAPIRSKGLLLVDCGIDPANADKAREAIMQQFAQMQAGAFGPDELEMSRISIRQAFEGISDSPEKINEFYAKQLDPGQPLWSPSQLAQAVAQITKEDVVRAAQALRLDTDYTLLPKEALAE